MRSRVDVLEILQDPYLVGMEITGRRIVKIHLLDTLDTAITATKSFLTGLTAVQVVSKAMYNLSQYRAVSCDSTGLACHCFVIWNDVEPNFGVLFRVLYRCVSLPSAGGVLEYLPVEWLA